MKLFEIRNSTLNQLEVKFPNMPRYVLIDLIYKALKDDMNSLPEYIKEFSDMRWNQTILTVTMDIFDKQTQNKLSSRAGGNSNPFNIPNDEQRHSTQNKLISAGPSKEPIIMVKTQNGFELVEGWHRTIQSLKKWPEGYKQSAWIGVK